jgi:hypothetical protein
MVGVVPSGRGMSNGSGGRTSCWSGDSAVLASLRRLRQA